MFITNDIKYIGVNDHKKDLFEGQYIIPDGMAYNSYVIMDEKIAVMDSVDADFGEEWLNNLEKELAGRTPDYLVVQHMEPDHSANITVFMDKYKEAVLVSSARAFTMMKQFFGKDYPDRRLVVKEGAQLELGAHTLSFVDAPLVHWPEVIMTWDSKDKVLFSADAFGKFGALDVEADWACEARRYYMGIVGKYGIQVQKVLKKAAALDIAIICPLHGPVLTENLSYYIDLYDTWSSYRPEGEGVTICVSSIYGHTMEAARLLADTLTKKGCPKVSVFDLARDDMAEAVEDAFRYDRLVLASVTYNGTIFPDMNTFISHLLERNYQNRTIAFVENGSWAPAGARIMGKLFEKSKNITIAQNTVTLRSALNEESIAQIEALAEELTA